MYFPLKVSIPEPCHEDWQQMTPVEFNQRHCQSCDRVLADSSSVTVNVRMESGVYIGTEHYLGYVIQRRSLPHRIFVAPVRRYIVRPTRQLIGKIREWKEERLATRPERQAAHDLRREERRASRKLTQLEAQTSTAPKPSPAPAAAPKNALHLTVSPNPFTDHLTVSFTCLLSKSIHWSYLTRKANL